jgi:serine/threonine-protein kinase
MVDDGRPASSPDSRLEMRSFSEDDDDVVTRIMMPAEDEEPPTTGSYSTVHAPAKSNEPAPQPAEPVVVRGATGQETAPPQGHYAPGPDQQDPPRYVRQPHDPAPYSQHPLPGVHHHGLPAIGQRGMPVHGPQGGYVQPPGAPQGGDDRTVVIALIAAITTLIALGLVAFVVLRLTARHRPAPSVAAATAPTTDVAVLPTLTATAVSSAPPSPPLTSSAAAERGEEAEHVEEPAAKQAPSKTRAHGTVPRAGRQAPSPPKDPGFLTVVCNPACDSVIAGGRDLGPSPVVRASLPPGTHSVRLRKSGVEAKSVSVKIVAGQTTPLRVTMGS